jgi:hypothetical protein
MRLCILMRRRERKMGRGRVRALWMPWRTSLRRFSIIEADASDFSAQNIVAMRMGPGKHLKVIDLVASAKRLVS